MKEEETEGDPTSPLSPLAPYPPIPSPEYRSRAAEFYGFVAWTSTSFLFCVYLLWALLPDEYIVWMGISWYPSREWALLFPAWSIVIALLTYFVYFALALYGTPSFSDMGSIIDSYAQLPPVDRDRNPYLSYARADVVPELYDIPIGMVNRVLYSSSQAAE
ncbi:PIG-P-domain-containing protein [Mycena sp. CBHHK59/15]|nr:PIG-P-domain-containing protein [Mycena sp. CBHHK59/15]